MQSNVAGAQFNLVQKQLMLHQPQLNVEQGESRLDPIASLSCRA
jgi:hypothetical protein